MKNLLILASALFSLSNIALANPEKEANKTEDTENKSSREEKKSAKKTERAHKVLETCEVSIKEAAGKEKELSGADKKMFELFVAHAKLEMDAAKDPVMADHIMKHARHCKRYIGSALKYIKSNKPADAKVDHKEEKKS